MRGASATESTAVGVGQCVHFNAGTATNIWVVTSAKDASSPRATHAGVTFFLRALTGVTLTVGKMELAPTIMGRVVPRATCRQRIPRGVKTM